MAANIQEITVIRKLGSNLESCKIHESPLFCIIEDDDEHETKLALRSLLKEKIQKENF